MGRTTWALALGLSVAIAGVRAAEVATPGFDKLDPSGAPAAWYFPDGFRSGSSLESREGVAILRLEAGRLAETSVRVPAGCNKMTISVGTRTEGNPPPAARLILRVELADGTSQPATIETSDAIIKDGSAKLVQAVTLPPGAVRLRIGLTASGNAGSALFDRVTVERPDGVAAVTAPLLPKPTNEPKAAIVNPPDAPAAAPASAPPGAATTAPVAPPPVAIAVPMVPILPGEVAAPPELANKPVAGTLLPDAAFHAEVEASMRRGIQYILQVREKYKREQQPGLNKPSKIVFEPHQGGMTHLAVYAMLQAGQCLGDASLRPRSPEIEPMLKWVYANQANTTYAVSLQASVLALAPDYPTRTHYVARLREVAGLLNNGLTNDNCYTYSLITRASSGDNSNGQYGALGLWALEDAGVNIPVETWNRVNQYWRGCQSESGGWGYTANTRGAVTPNMSLAGIATLYVVSEYLQRSQVGLVPIKDPNLERALAWLDRENLGFLDLYGMYCLERVGLASGKKYIRQKNWFRFFAQQLMSSQRPDGSFGENMPNSMTDDPDHVINTAYGILYLARGSNAVAFSKLNYGTPVENPPSRWNARAFDVANLTRKMQKNYEAGLNWQIEDLSQEPEEWLDSPILIITGSVDPGFTPDQIAKLRRYIEYGGIILSSSDGDRTEFTSAMQRYANLIFEGKNVMRALPPDHVLYTAAMPIKPPAANLLGLSNGIREVWVHSPTDLGAAWQSWNWTRNPAALAVPANLYLYATDKAHPQHRKLRDLTFDPGPMAAIQQVKLGRVIYDGNWDPEPGAWRRQTKLMLRDTGTRVDIKTVTVDALNAEETPLIHMVGTGGFSLTEAERNRLAAFLKAGGQLVLEAGGGNAEFIKSAKELCAQLYPAIPLDELPGNHPLYTGEMPGGTAVGNKPYRHYYTLSKGPSNTAHLQGIRLGDRYPVLLSEEDLSSGLLNTHLWAIPGYTPEAAQALIRNLLCSVAKPVK